MKIFTPDTNIQFQSKEEIKIFQEKRMKETLSYVSTHSKFYKNLFINNKIKIESIKHIEDLHNIPVTTKKDLQLYNKDFLCVNSNQVIDYVTTSGTLGDPVTFGLTANDLQRLAYNEAASYTTAGCSTSDIIQLMTTIDRRFMAGLAYFLGAYKLGCGIIRVGNGIPELQWDTIRRISPNVCMVVPSFILKLIDYAKGNNINFRNSSLKKAICIGEALRTPELRLSTLGLKINTLWPELIMHSTYASTEMQTSFTECDQLCGGHLPPDLIIVELLDNNNNPVQPGEEGEVTITNIGVEGMPLVRFKTGDICKYYNEPCKCGRNTIRLSPLLGRKGQMIKFKGTTLYPPALYDILDNITYIHNYIIEVYTNEIGTDDILIRISSDYQSEDTIKHIKDSFRAKVRVAPQIVFEPKEVISKKQNPQMSRKVVKFIDLRDNKNI